MNHDNPPREPVICLNAERAKRARPPEEPERTADPLAVLEIMIEGYCSALLSQIQELKEQRK